MKIIGEACLQGKIKISGAKNSVLPLMALGLLSAYPIVLENVPYLADVMTMKALLERLGACVHHCRDRLVIHTEKLEDFCAPYDIVRKMRASVLVLGPLVARYGKARVSLPGGCAIGTRPINYHLEGLKALGAKVSIENGDIYATAPKGGFRGGEYTFPTVTVTGTENLIFVAALSDGVTVLKNVAKEPEIGDLLVCLEKMGIKVEGKGTCELCITGTSDLKGVYHSVLPDRIELGTYIIATAITNGETFLSGASLDLLGDAVTVLRKAGIAIEQIDQELIKVKRNGPLCPVDIETSPFPGFPTDLQAQMMGLLTLTEGTSSISETIFENRFMHVCELLRMGANITINGSTALIKGVPFLSGASVMATDLRASVCLVLAALAAKGSSVINRIYHLDRGYEKLEEKLVACGAVITRLSMVA